MKKRVVFFGFIAIIVLFNFKVKAATFKDNQVVQATKSWTIHFNQEISLDDLSKQGITVVDGNGIRVNITVSLGSDSKTIVINPPAAGYKAGSTYKLIIGNKVHSKQNKNIKQQSVMNFSIEKGNEDDVVTFKDPNLEKAVRDSINKPTGVLYKKDVDKITYLNAQNKNIVYLDGIENLTNLVTAHLGGNGISDISALKGLHNLGGLRLENNQIDNIDVLKDLNNLQELYLTSNQIQDINSLESLSKLSYLDITDNPIKDISVLTKLNKLDHLNFGGNLSNMDCLKQIKSLKGINGYFITDINKFFKVYDKANEIIKAIIKPGMSDLEKEKAIHDYIVLNAKYDEDNYFKNTMTDDDYSPYGILINGTGVCQGYADTTQLLLNMVGIKCIVVVGKGNGGDHAWNIVQIGGKYYQLDTTWDDPIPDKAGYVRYNYFNISDKELSKDHKWTGNYPKCTGSLSKDGVSGDTVITFKDCNLEQVVRKILNRPDGNIIMDDVKNIRDIQYYPTDESKKIKDLSGIENFEGLEYLQLDGNGIENIEPLKDIKTLKVLNLGDNKISNINVLSNLTQLTYLSLADDNVSNIDMLKGMTNLTDLDLRDNNIENIDVLEKMVGLQSLLLSNNKISNINALVNLSNMSMLWIDENNISNIDALNNMTKLQTLMLSDNNISNIDVLSKLNKLSLLYLNGNPLNQNDITDLKKALSNCNISY